MLATVLFTVFAKIEQLHGIALFGYDILIIGNPREDFNFIFMLIGIIGFGWLSWLIFKWLKIQYYRAKVSEYISSRFGYLLAKNVFPDNSIEGDFGEWSKINTSDQLKRIKDQIKQDASNEESLKNARHKDVDDKLNEFFRYYEFNTDK